MPTAVAITGFSVTSLLNMAAGGVMTEDIVVPPHSAFGVRLYGNVIIANPRLIEENPQAVQAFPGRGGVAAT